MKTIILFTLLFITINCGRTVIMCHDDPFKDEQCMKTETLGKNTFVWVRKCKGAKVCVDLPYYNDIIGACSIKVDHIMMVNHVLMVINVVLVFVMVLNVKD